MRPDVTATPFGDGHHQDRPTRARLAIALGIATMGRPDTVRTAVADLARQTRRPDRVIVSVAAAEDFDVETAPECGVAVERVIGPTGSALQRNTILNALDGEDVVLFLDDDFVMAPEFLAELERLFLGHPEVAVATGHVVADGILGAGIGLEEARARLDRLPPPRDDIVDVHNAYGCNMAFRLGPIREHRLRFDERLPLYAWLEDVDFSRQVATFGRSVRAMRLRGVHLGIKRGRTSGLRFGYSQVANPIHLISRGSMGHLRALRIMGRNILANLGKSLWAEPWVDRCGRLRGNLIGLGDLLRGRLDPERILDLDATRDRSG
jgi:glycosyltransferase involved in cell wall biosynthesis